MIQAIFTLDYEIHGNGEGDPYALMVEPTRRLLDQFDSYGAKLTIMADVAEILRFKAHWESTGRDVFHYQAIASQLLEAIRRGHDVQLHLHSSYFNSRFENGRWEQDYSEYSFADLPVGRMQRYLQVGKNYLQTLLRTAKPDYECVAFRAANWSMHPSHNAVAALVKTGFHLDTSVFRYGRRAGRVRFDYTNTHSDVIPWRCSQRDACLHDPHGKLWEVPIYSEERSLIAFFSLSRLYRAAVSRVHPVDAAAKGDDQADQSRRPHQKYRWFSSIVRRHAWKADFNQCTGRQLIAALERAYAKYGNLGPSMPFTLIGHSKLLTRFNQSSLAPFLQHVARRQDRFRFALFRDLDFTTFQCPARDLPQGESEPPAATA